MPLGFVEIDYYIPRQGPEGLTRALVRGIQIGRIAVRHVLPGDDAQALPPADTHPWRVDHIPTGYSIAAFDNFDHAYAFADDFSRFSKRDPSSKERERSVLQVGKDLRAWTVAANRLAEEGAFISFRDWLAQQGKEWKPRRRLKPIKLFG